MSKGKFRTEEELLTIKRSMDEMKIRDLKSRLNLPRKYRDKHLSDFIVSEDMERHVEFVMKAILARQSLYISGDTGKGKTLLACIIANERAERLNRVKFWDTSDFLLEMNPYYSGNPEESLKTRLNASRTACLILDDLGAEKVTETSIQGIFGVLNARYANELQTIITSNFKIAELKEIYGGIQGRRIISRLEEIMHEIYLP